MAERVVSVKLKADIAQYVSSMRTAGRATTDLEKASLRVQSAFSDEEDAAGRVRVAEARLTEVRKSGRATAAQLAQAEEQLANAMRSHEQARQRAIIVGQEFIDSQRELTTASEDAEDAVTRVGAASDRVARRANARFKLLATTIGASLPAASSLAAGAITAGPAAAFAALGAVALRENEAILESFQGLGRQISTGLEQDAAVLESTFVGVADRLGAAYEQLRPQMQEAFAASTPAVEHLTEGVIALAEGAMPGMVTAVQRSEPVFEGLRSMLGDVGDGVGEFATEVSTYSDEAGQGMEHLGSLIQGVLGETAPLLGTLTTAWAEHGDEVAEVITQLIGVVGGLAGSAMPALSTATGAALQVLSGVLDVIEPMLPVLGPLVGTWLSLAAAMKAIGAVRGAVGGAATAMGGLAESFRDAETRGSRFRRAAGAIALGIAGIAAESRRLNPDIEALTSGLEEFATSGRLGGEAARVLGTDMGDLQYAFEAVNSNDFDKAITSVVEGVTGLVGYAPFEEAQERIKGLDDSLAGMVNSGNAESAAAVVQELAERTGLSVEAIGDALPGYTAAVETLNERTQALGTTALQSTPGIRELEESLATLADQTADTADRADALNDAWRRLFGVSLDLKDAQAEFEGGLDDISESITSVKEGTAAWEDALFTSSGAVNLATEEGRELHELLTAEGEAYKALAITAYDTARQQGKSQQEATAIAIESVNARRAQFIREQVALGVTRERAEALANEYLGIPGDVVTTIHSPGMASALQSARALSRAYNSIPSYIRTTVEAVLPGPALFALRLAGMFRDGGLVGGYADGGLPRFPAGGLFRGAGGPRDDANLIAISDGEYITNAEDTARNLAALEAGNNGAKLVALGPGGSVVAGMADGGMVRGTPMAAAGGASVTYNLYAPNYVGSHQELLSTLRKAVQTRGGDVAAVLGGR